MLDVTERDKVIFNQFNKIGQWFVVQGHVCLIPRILQFGLITNFLLCLFVSYFNLGICNLTLLGTCSVRELEAEHCLIKIKVTTIIPVFLHLSQFRFKYKLSSAQD